MYENIKKAFRWAIRRDFDAGNTMFGGIVERLSTAFTTIVGAVSGIGSGSIAVGIVYATTTFACLFVAKCVLGYIDLRYAGATKYRNWYGSHVAPMYVKLIDDEKKSNST